MNDDPNEYERRHGPYTSDWKLQVEPFEQRSRDANQGAVALGQAGLKTGLVLNGGALILVPAYLKLFAVSLDQNLIWVALGLLCFVVGVVGAWLGILAAYFTLVGQGLAAREHADAIASRLNVDHRAPESREEHEPHLKKLERDTIAAWKASERWRRFAITLGVTSLLTFVAGAVISAWVMLA